MPFSRYSAKLVRTFSAAPSEATLAMSLSTMRCTNSSNDVLAGFQPNFAFVREWLKRHGETATLSQEALAKDPRVHERIGQEIERINKRLGKWEQVKVFGLTSDEWSIDAGHLTPTLKLKRRIILEKYKDMYNTLYNKES